MLSEPHEHRRPFDRRDATRLLIAAILLLATLGVGVLVDVAPTRPSYAVGTVAPSAIQAPRDAQFPNDVETEQARQAAREDALPVYDYSAQGAATRADQQVGLLKTELQPLDNAFSANVAAEARQIAINQSLLDVPEPDRTTGRTLLSALPVSRWPAVREAAIAIVNSGERDEIRDTEVNQRRAALIALYMPDGLSSSEQQLAGSIAGSFLVANSAYSDALTQKARDAAAAKVPTVLDSVKAGEVIVDGGHVITPSDMVKIRALGLNAGSIEWGRLGSWMLLNLLVVALLLAWLWRFRPEYWHRTRTLVLIGLIFVVTALAIKLGAGRPALPYIVPTAAAGMLLAVLLDASTATIMIAVLSVLAGNANTANNPLEVMTYVLLCGIAGIMLIRKGDRIAYFVQAALAMTVTGAFVIGVFTLLNQHDTTGLIQLSGASALAAAGAAIVTIGTFAGLGNAFGILTGFQLLELANPSQPLLRRLLTETPGTYHHALMVGNLAERAAAAIGADPLLTRVAAYYHDVGKLANPLAFIENQAGADNIHDQLDPEDSAAILKQHVPDGIDLAYKAKLPKPLIAFIPQHHGTALLSYFYAKAREAAAEPFGGLATPDGRVAADAVDQRRFRHAGPKPQSREAALLMLADGVEASVRSLASRDDASIRAMVGRIIDERMQDGQLNECDLTIRDLERVREAFVQQLLGMYHQRIAYPQNKIVELESRRERGLG